MGTKRSAPLADLVARLPASSQVNGDTQRLVTGIAIDSRCVQPGALFAALPGTRSDGHAFIASAAANGAIAVVVEAGTQVNVPSHVTTIFVPDARRAVSVLASAFYGDPSESLDVAGVTGTNGKTTTTRMIAAMLDRAAKPCGVIGTVGAQFAEHAWPLANTTPLPPQLHGLLAEMRDCGAKAVAMEVSSHALALERVDDVAFAVAALTNVTRDHLDFHQTLEAYAAAKRRLFSMARACVFNADDEHGARWAPEVAARGVRVLTYAEKAHADIVAQHVTLASDGSSFRVDGREYVLRIPGRFNVLNALAAIGVARLLGASDDAIADGLAGLERVPGRMEHQRGGGIDVVVDYAHTPDALDNALRSLRETAEHRVCVVFGCGGDRDAGKRPEMGAAAARYADHIYVTSDNPRGEDPQAIVDAILPGIGVHPHVVELDRRRAIERAVAEAEPGDVVLVAGKGHEAYQVLGEHVFDFDDATIVRDALAARGVMT